MSRACFIIVVWAIWLLGSGFPQWKTVCRAEDLSRELRRPIRVERDMEFRQIDGQSLTADLYRPDDDQLYPLVVMIHGGAWSAGDKRNLADHARELAQAGFVAVSINYRLAPRYQLPAQIDDCRMAVRWAAQQAPHWQADADRLCLWGYSAGAHLAAWLATLPQPGQPLIRCVVAGGAPCDFEFVPADSRTLAHVMGGTRAELPEVYLQASPLTHATSSAPAFFLFHGSSDLLVPPSSSRRLYEKLQQLQVPAEYHLVEGRGHMLTFLDPASRRRAIDFLRKQTTEAPH